MMVIDNSSKDIKTMLDELKPAKLNKNNKVISTEDIEKIIDYTKQVSKTTQSVRDINGLNKFIDDFEDKYEKMHYKNFELENQLETKDDEIYRLNVIINKKDENINKLQQDVTGLKGQVSKLKQFWHNIMKHFQNRINYDKDENYKIVSDDLYRNGIFSDDDYEIANNLNKRVELKEDAESNTECDENVIIGKYGRARLNYIKTHKRGLYAELLMNGTLNKHLAEIDRTANERINRIIKQIAEQNNTNEKLKETNQLLWAGLINNYKLSAEEIVYNELIFS